jgi:hypothetical protein
MLRKFKNITSSLLLMVFLLPSIVKLEHHHKHPFSETQTANHSLFFTEKCSICSFEFSVFLSDFGYVDLAKGKPIINYFNNYDSVDHSNSSKFSFSLRAPPLNINS